MLKFRRKAAFDLLNTHMKRQDDTSRDYITERAYNQMVLKKYTTAKPWKDSKGDSGINAMSEEMMGIGYPEEIEDSYYRHEGEPEEEAEDEAEDQAEE